MEIQFRASWYGLRFSIVINGEKLETNFLSEYEDRAPDPNPDYGYHLALVKDEYWIGIYLNGILFGEFELENNHFITLGEGGWMIPDPRRPSQGFAMCPGNEIRISDVALLPSQFLCAAIPEPSTLVLLTLGGGLLAAKRRKK